MKFYLDEELTPIIAVALRKRGVDAVSAHELGQIGLSDAEQLSFAAGQGRCLVSANARDFRRLGRDAIEQSRPHAGIVLCPPPQHPGGVAGALTPAPREPAVISRGVFQWKALLDLGPFHWRAVAPWRAARVGIGVLVPLVFGWASGHVQYGAFASLGALPAGFGSFQGVSRTRAATVIAAGIGMAVSTFIGATIAGTPWFLLLFVIAYGYVAGLRVCVGPMISVVVLQWAAGLLIAAGMPLPPAQAALRAVLVLAGGLFQAALVACAWLFHPGDRERAALGASYRALTRYAAGFATGNFEAPAPIAFPATTSLADPNPLLPTTERLMLIDLLEEAERVRASLAALAAEASRLHVQDRDRLHHFAAGVAGTLELIASALEARRDERSRRTSDASRRLTELMVASDVPWRWAGEALVGQLRAVVGILRSIDALTTADGGNSGAGARGSSRPCRRSTREWRPQS